MQKHIPSMRRLAIVTLAAFPLVAMALPPTTSPYYTDVTNSYVQDQTSEVMGQLNGILCYMGAMAPAQMVNLSTNNGNYIALIDQNICEAKGSGGQSNNTGAAYVAAIVNSTRTSNNDPMNVKVWLAPQPGQDLAVYASASQAPNTTTLPYGVFRMDYCGGGTPCTNDKGYINATASGLSFYQSYSDSQGYSGSTALKLNATGSGTTATGNGAIHRVQSWTNPTPGSNTSDFKFAYNANYFVRNDGIDPTATGDRCFDRDPANASESVWRYGLYDAANGTHINRNSGFPVEYVDTSVTPNVTYNGYIGYYGLWMPVNVLSGSTIKQVTYTNTGPVKTPYTLITTGGKLMKYTTANTTLAALNKVTFWYYAQNNIPATGTAIMTAGSSYELFWDDTATQFKVSGKQNTSSGNMEPYAIPLAIANADMLAANSWGLFGWSQMLGGQFGIQGSDFANLTGISPSTIPVKVQTQDVVYPSQFAALGNLTCINDCPTASLIAVSNAGTGSAFEPTTAGWTPVSSTQFSTYTLNPTTGNLIDPANGVVVSTATSGINAYGVRSGRMLASADATANAAAMIAAKNASNVCGGTCTTFNQGDVDFLPVGKSYYQWETGGQPWNQLAILMNGSTPVTFDPPLQVSFAVPNTAKYGSYAGANISLQYGGFGDLWGIPNECVDITTNLACDFTPTTGTAQNNMRWTSKFSIPFNATTGVVTANAGATTYLVKPLDKEVRLAKVDCAGTGLPATSGLSAVTLPGAGGFIDPTPKTGAMPTFTTVPAPQVIHGVKQY